MANGEPRMKGPRAPSGRTAAGIAFAAAACGLLALGTARISSRVQRFAGRDMAQALASADALRETRHAAAAAARSVRSADETSAADAGLERLRAERRAFAASAAAFRGSRTVDGSAADGLESAFAVWAVSAGRLLEARKEESVLASKLLADAEALAARLERRGMTADAANRVWEAAVSAGFSAPEADPEASLRRLETRLAGAASAPARALSAGARRLSAKRRDVRDLREATEAAWTGLERSLAEAEALASAPAKRLTAGLAADTRRSASWLFLSLAAFAAAAGGFLYAAGRSLSGSLQEILRVVEAGPNGETDLTAGRVARTGGETGGLARGLNALFQGLRETVAGVRGGAEQVERAAAALRGSAAELATGAEQHGRRAREVSSSVEEMGASIRDTSKNASRTARVAEESTGKARGGAEAMEETRRRMDAIVEAANRMSRTVLTLSDRAGRIGEILQVIDKIADQTNLLALNAAIEAARAGEQGAGFAVVADEVRKLAERTTEATDRIEQTLAAIQADTREASDSMDGTHAAVRLGREAVDRARAMLDELLGAVAQSADMIQQIAAAAEEQSAVSEEISAHVEEMTAVSRRSADIACRMAASAEELGGFTRGLWDSVARFKA
jgi:methyl-accepting chemotaxis protein